MHQTFYIDIDEEITSIVEKLKGARTKEIIMVVPKHALLIQSIVNLRILKKEADEAGLQLMMITQDKLGKILIEKAGIFVQQKMDNISDEEISLNGDSGGEQTYGATEEAEEKNDEKDRLNRIGSQNYFYGNDQKKTPKEFLAKNRKNSNEEDSAREEGEKLINRELVYGVNADGKSRQQNMDLSAVQESRIAPDSSLAEERETGEKFNVPASANQYPNFPKNSFNAVDFSSETKGYSQDKNKKIESFFHQPDKFESRPEKSQNKSSKEYNLSGRSHKFFWFFGLLAVLIIIGTGAYLFLPELNLKIITKMEKKSADSEIKGEVSAASSDYDKKIIPARAILIDEEFAKTFNSTGDKAVSNQKAKGKITIYNEYGASPQSLVATTRFLSEDGKLFRLVKGVTIPGMKKVDGEMKLGTVEAQVVADQSGKDFNIGPGKFTIPGFENSGNDKYSKFYGKSEQAMAGGGDSGEKVNSITQEDIDSAKNFIASSLDSLIKQKLEEKAGGNVIILDDAVKKEETIFSFSNSPGDVAGSFSILAKIKAEAIVVGKKDFDEMAGSIIVKSENSQSSFDYESMVVDFSKPKVDFKAGTIDIKFRVSGKMNPNLNLDEIKKGILGKNEENLKAYLSSFPDIKQIELHYQPEFINNKVPFFEKRVKVVLDKQ